MRVDNSIYTQVVPGQRFFSLYISLFFFTSVLPSTRLGEFSTLLPGGEDDDNNQVAPSYQLDQP